MMPVPLQGTRDFSNNEGKPPPRKMDPMGEARFCLFVVVCCCLSLVSAWVPSSGLCRGMYSQSRVAACMGVGGISSSLSGPSSEAGQGKAALIQKLLSTAALAARDPRRHEGDLVSVVEELEGMNPTPDPATSELFNGKWALLYAATLQRSGQSVGGDGALQAFLDTSYDSVRKFLPALAGVGGGGSRSFQIVNIGRGQVDNTVDFQPPIGPELHILVKGSVGRSAVNPGVRAEVTFESFSARLGNGPAIKLPLPRPVGAIDVTYLDEKVRISRGSRGTLFVAARSIE